MKPRDLMNSVNQIRRPAGTLVTRDALAKVLGMLAPQVGHREEDLSVIMGLEPRARYILPRTVINDQGDPSDMTYIVTSGWGCTYVDLPDGRRQIADFQLKGDVIGLRAEGAAWDESFHAISDMEVVAIPTGDLNSALISAPSIAVKFLFALARSSAIRGEHLVDIGRRSASVRLTHLLLELGARLEDVGEAESDGYACPLTQHDLADALGLTSIHVNRMLRELRQSGLLNFKGGRITFLNKKSAAALAHFDRSYL